MWIVSKFIGCTTHCSVHTKLKKGAKGRVYLRQSKCQLWLVKLPQIDPIALYCLVMDGKKMRCKILLYRKITTRYITKKNKMPIVKKELIWWKIIAFILFNELYTYYTRNVSVLMRNQFNRKQVTELKLIYWIPTALPSTIAIKLHNLI